MKESSPEPAETLPAHAVPGGAIARRALVRAGLGLAGLLTLVLIGAVLTSPVLTAPAHAAHASPLSPLNQTASANLTSPASPAPPMCGPDWTVVFSPNPQPDPYYANILNGVGAVSASDAWAVGYYGLRENPYSYRQLIEHYNGTRWDIVPDPGPVPALAHELNGVAAVSSSDVWAVGDYYERGAPTLSLVEHYNGTQWSLVPSPNQGEWNVLTSVSAISARDVWAVGYHEGGTLIEHFDGSAWAIVPSPDTGTPGSYLRGVAAVSDRDVWAVGYYYEGAQTRTLIEHYDGANWTIVSSPNQGTSDSLYGLAAVSATNVWAVGSYFDSSTNIGLTLIEHWDGTRWTIVPSPNPGRDYDYLFGVAAVSGTDVWAVGMYSSGTLRGALIEHYDGTSWAVVSSPNPGPSSNLLEGVDVVSATDVWAAGSYDNPQNFLESTLIERYNPCVPTLTPTVTPSQTPTRTPTRTRTPSTATATAHTATPIATLTPTPSVTPSTSATAQPCNVSFSDVLPTDYFYQAVQYLACHGAISGYSDGTFRPYNYTTRGQVTKIVILGFGIPIDTSGGPHFADVPPTHPFFQYVETANHYGLVSGYSDGTFRPYNNVTRGQLSKIVVLAAIQVSGWILFNPPVPTFTDVAAGSSFYPYVETAVSKGVISGYSDHTFRPGNDATRGQISKITYLAVITP